MKKILIFAKREVIILSLLFLIILSIIIEPSLFSFRHIRNIFFEAAPLVLLCAAFSLCLLCGFLDFSFAAVAGFAGVVSATLLQQADTQVQGVAQAGLVLLIIAALLVIGGIITVLNVYIVTSFRIAPALCGFVIGGILQGLSVILLTGFDGEAKILSRLSPQFAWFGIGHIGSDPVYSLPFVVLVTVAALVAVFVILRKLAWNSRYASISSTFNSLYVPGTTIPVKKLFKPMIPVAAISGACYALGGMMISSKVTRIVLSDRFTLDMMNGTLIIILAGAFIGKVSIFGGKGSFLGAAAGMFLVTAVFYALDFVLVPAGVQLCLQYLIIAAVIIKDLYIGFSPS